MPNIQAKTGWQCGQEYQWHAVIVTLRAVGVALTTPSWLEAGAIPVELIGYYRFVEILMLIKFNTALLGGYSIRQNGTPHIVDIAKGET